ncbi:GerAB/ArcD/ProY family transporter [Petroclostridium sp. X23]|uniref:GerAB/ArcD/ProY family transporter n=1 Tax=Petroclostridium sp. X23 TaxID=3045146 RepID=UPI0024ACA142|nr:GerAB/ArcD/ProY family transporter [Petroclostridium sp. X23]WHH60210.1 GerAB/ArcD/ProY family transporter [Petroclostridium sp. X23]
MNFDMRISNYQLFALLVMHSLGSSTLFARGVEVKQNAWVMELISLTMGFGVIWIHTELQKSYPRKNLAEINITLFGKVFGGVLTVLFAGYFMWISSLNFSEFSELISITALQTTPILAIQCIFILVIIYFTFKNIEVIARTSEILMPYVMLSLILLYILIAVSGKIDLKELQPVLANGIKPVLKKAFPEYAAFPYGENVVFLMYYCYVNKSDDIRKYAFSAIFMLGSVLFISTTTIVTVLGVEFTASSTIPLVEVIRLIGIGDIITNIDAIGVIVIFIGGFFKAMLFFYGSVLALSTLFKIKREVMIVVMAVFLIWFNLIKIPSFVYHRFLATEFTDIYLHQIYTIYVPFLLLVVIKLKNLNKRKDNSIWK